MDHRFFQKTTRFRDLYRQIQQPLLLPLNDDDDDDQDQDQEHQHHEPSPAAAHDYGNRARHYFVTLLFVRRLGPVGPTIHHCVDHGTPEEAARLVRGIELPYTGTKHVRRQTC